MADVAWLFPGQGSQRVGMGRALAASSPTAANVFGAVDEALGFPLSEIIFNGPEDELVATRNQQPALLAVSVAYARVLQERGLLPDPVCLAGHSLGEYSALVVGGALDLADAARLVRRRGELMEAAGLGGMIAVIGLDEPKLAAIASATGVTIANDNAPGQITLSGRAEALTAAAERAREAGARRVIPLAVNAAFHSPLMAPVVEGLRPLLAGMRLAAPRAPLIADVDAALLLDPEDLRRELLAQITASVRWVGVVRRAVALGAGVFYELGPGKVLSGLVRRIAPDAETRTAEELLG